jgi:hypothetical protein
MRLNYIHIMEPMWTYSNYLQVTGRGFRYCWHKTLPNIKRQITIYNYISTIEGYESTDEYISRLANDKINIIGQLEKCLQKSSINNFLFE